jgi:ABC-type spermidine/putrescine transport system permease subunit II
MSEEPAYEPEFLPNLSKARKAILALTTVALVIGLLYGFWEQFFKPQDKNLIELVGKIANVTAAIITAFGAVLLALFPNSEVKKRGLWWGNTIGRCAIAGGAIFIAVTLCFGMGPLA